jgi:alpha-ketoglutarate-dependent taurine dioxygenase
MPRRTSPQQRRRLARLSGQLRPHDAAAGAGPEPPAAARRAHEPPSPLRRRRRAPPAGVASTPLTPEFGKRIEGLSAAACVADPAGLGQWLVDELYASTVLVIASQEDLVLDPPLFSAFAGLFGRTYQWAQYQDGNAIVPGCADIMPLANVAGAAVPSDFDPNVKAVMAWDETESKVRVNWDNLPDANEAAAAFRNDNCMFHTDHSSLELPGATTCLLPVEVPLDRTAPGCATDFCCLSLARRSLPAALEAGIQGRVGLHGYGPGMLDAWMCEHAGDPIPAEPAPGTSDTREDWTRHELDLRHPITGVPTIWFAVFS